MFICFTTTAALLPQFRASFKTRRLIWYLPAQIKQRLDSVKERERGMPVWRDQKRERQGEREILFWERLMWRRWGRGSRFGIPSVCVYLKGQFTWIWRFCYNSLIFFVFWSALGHNLSKFCQTKNGSEILAESNCTIWRLNSLHLSSLLFINACYSKKKKVYFFLSLKLHSADVTKAMWAENNNVNQQYHSPLFTI